MMIKHIMKDTEEALQHYRKKGDIHRIKILEDGILYFIATYINKSR